MTATEMPQPRCLNQVFFSHANKRDATCFSVRKLGESILHATYSGKQNPYSRSFPHKLEATLLLQLLLLLATSAHFAGLTQN